MMFPSQRPQRENPYVYSKPEDEFIIQILVSIGFRAYRVRTLQGVNSIVWSRSVYKLVEGALIVDWTATKQRITEVLGNQEPITVERLRLTNILTAWVYHSLLILDGLDNPGWKSPLRTIGV